MLITPLSVAAVRFMCWLHRPSLTALRKLQAVVERVETFESRGAAEQLDPVAESLLQSDLADISQTLTRLRAPHSALHEPDIWRM